MLNELNGMRRSWAAARTALGVWVTLPSSLNVEWIVGDGLDYVCFDLQHGLGGFDSLAAQIAACSAAGPTPLVRTPGNEPFQIGKALDLGALGVIVPLVASPEAAAAAVAACRYPPTGVRSYGPTRLEGVVGTADPSRLEREALCFVMVENREGLECVEAIAATAGLDGIYVGPADLGISMGLGPHAFDHPDHIAATERIRAACVANGIRAGVHGHSGAQARERAAQGFEFVTVTTDTTVLRAGVARELAAAREPAET